MTSSRKQTSTKSVPKSFHCRINGHIRPNCFLSRSQRLWTKWNVPRQDKLGYGNQVRSLTKQVKLISERLDELSNSSSMDEKNTTQGNYDHPVTTS
jgi:hypothetical protein